MNQSTIEDETMKKQEEHQSKQKVGRYKKSLNFPKPMKIELNTFENLAKNANKMMVKDEKRKQLAKQARYLND